jgi:hypothetical protein
VIGVRQVEVKRAVDELRLPLLAIGEDERLWRLRKLGTEDLPKLTTRGGVAIAQRPCAKASGAVALIGGEQSGASGELHRREFERCAPNRDHRDEKNSLTTLN